MLLELWTNFLFLELKAFIDVYMWCIFPFRCNAAQKYKHLIGSISTRSSLFTINILLSTCRDEMSCSSTLCLLYLLSFTADVDFQNENVMDELQPSISPHQCPPSACFFGHILNFTSNRSRNDVKPTLRPLSHIWTTAFVFLVFVLIIAFRFRCLQMWMCLI